MKALTVRQPWAWLLFHGKSIENRDWWTNWYGPLAIHAALNMARDEYADAVDFVRSFDPELVARIPLRNELVFGCVIGTVDQVGCVTKSDSFWFCGKVGHIYVNPRLLVTPIPAKGKLGIWEWKVPEEGLRYAA